ncbi:MAG: DNA-directed RNA polymerase subunit omega [Firmicutes bacterium]|nr:DNA-directed RNA polymerase subunit omega [Bacillota bacterium]
MLYPSIDSLMRLVDSKYTLVIAASKRARALQEGAKPHLEVKSGKLVSVALKELDTAKITYVHTKDGVK